MTSRHVPVQPKSAPAGLCPGSLLWKQGDKRVMQEVDWAGPVTGNAESVSALCRMTVRQG